MYGQAFGLLAKTREESRGGKGQKEGGENCSYVINCFEGNELDMYIDNRRRTPLLI